MRQPITVSLVMLPYLPAEIPDRLDSVLSKMSVLVDQAAAIGADLVAFPEMCNTWGAADPWQSESLDGRTLSAMAKKARQRSVYILCPMLTLIDGVCHNSAVLIDRSGALLGYYHKNFPTHMELDHGVLPGTQTPVFETDRGRIGMAICFDLNYWEVGSSLCAGKAELVIWPSMWKGARMLTRWAVEFNFAMGAVSADEAMFVDLAGREINSAARAALEPLQAAPLHTTTIDLDKRVIHHDYNLERLPALFQKYGPLAAFVEHIPQECLVIFNSLIAGKSSDELIVEFGLEPMRDYLARARRDRRLVLEGKYVSN